MEIVKIVDAVEWLENESSLIRYGEASVKVIVHDGTIKRIELSMNEKIQPGTLDK